MGRRICLSKDAIAAAAEKLPERLRNDTRFAHDNIRHFAEAQKRRSAEAQKRTIGECELEIELGLITGQKPIPVDAAGC